MDFIYYDRQGNPMSQDDYIAQRYGGDLDAFRVGIDEIGPYVISTVWLGLDHGFGDGPPVIFETMVFASEAWYADRRDPDHLPLIEFDCQRYCTEEEAQAGHDEMVLLVRATTTEIPDGVDEEEKPMRNTRKLWVLALVVFLVSLLFMVLVQVLVAPAGATKWGAMYQPSEHPDEYRWASHARVARIFDSNSLGVWNDYPAAKRAYADGVRTFVFSWKGTSLQDIRDFDASVPAGVKVFGVYLHEPEDDIEGGRITLAQWKERTIAQAAVMKDVGMVPTTILMVWTLYPGLSGRDVTDYDLPTGTVKVHGFDAHIRGDKKPDVVAKKLRREMRRSGLPMGVAETSGTPSDLRIFRSMMNRKGVHWVCSFTTTTGVNQEWTDQMNNRFYGLRS